MVGELKSHKPYFFANRKPRNAGSTLVWDIGNGTYGVFATAAFDWCPHDNFIETTWVAHEHTASSGAVSFLYSDRVVQEKLDFCKEQRARM